MSLAIPTFKLYTGKLVPAVAYGTGTAWARGRAPGAVDQRLVESLKTAIKLGYRHLDTAEFYGTEKDLGVAIKESGVPREELFITHKISRNESLNDVPGTLEAALKDMDLNYVDSYLLHSPFFEHPPLKKVWEGLEEVHDAGKAKHIGVSNFNLPQLEELLSFARVKPAMNQIEYNPYCVDQPLLEFQKKHDIIQSAYAPLSPITKFSGGALDKPLEEISKSKGVTPAQVLLKWVLANGVVAVTTTSNEERMKAFGSMGFDLSEDELEKVAQAGAKEHHRGFWLKQYGDV